MPKWHRTDYKLQANHGWRATPGYRLCVLGAGQMQFEFPQDWHLEPKEMSIKVTDKRPPDDDCVLEVSSMKFPPLKPERPSLTILLQQAIMEQGHMLDSNQIVTAPRQDAQIVWGEYREIDSKENREAVWRIALCHAGTVYGLITFGFWPEDWERCDPLWHHVLNTLILDRPISDPTRGPILN